MIGATGKIVDGKIVPLEDSEQKTSEAEPVKPAPSKSKKEDAKKE